MPLRVDRFRRGLGIAFLTASVGMLIAGQTFLKSRLQDMAYVNYWLLCFVFTALAAMTAFLDLRVMRERSRAEQRELIEKTLNDAKNNPRK